MSLHYLEVVSNYRFRSPLVYDSQSLPDAECDVQSKRLASGSFKPLAAHGEAIPYLPPPETSVDDNEVVYI